MSAAVASFRAALSSPKEWTFAHCGDQYFECSMAMENRGMKKYLWAVCPASRSFRYTYDEKGDGLLSIPWSRVRLPIVPATERSNAFIVKIGGVTDTSSSLVSGIEHRLENERDRDAVLRFLNGLLGDRPTECLDFGGPTLPMPILHGPCQKKGRFTYSARYAVLQHGRLLIWRSQAAFLSHHHPPINVLSLSFVAVERHSEPCVLQVKKADRDYTLQFGAFGERDRWAQAIEAVSAFYKAPATVKVPKAKPAASAAAASATTANQTVAAAAAAASPTVAEPVPSAALPDVRPSSTSVVVAPQPPSTFIPPPPSELAEDDEADLFAPPPSAAEADDQPPPPAAPPAEDEDALGGAMPPPPPEEEEQEDLVPPMDLQFEQQIEAQRGQRQSTAARAMSIHSAPSSASAAAAASSSRHVRHGSAGSTVPSSSEGFIMPSGADAAFAAPPAALVAADAHATSHRATRTESVRSAHALGFFDASAVVDDSVPPPPPPPGEGDEGEEDDDDDDDDYYETEDETSRRSSMRTSDASSATGGSSSAATTSTMALPPAVREEEDPSTFIRINILLSIVDPIPTAAATAAGPTPASRTTTLPLGLVFVPPSADLMVVRQLIGEELDGVPEEYTFLLGDDIPVGKRQEARLGAAALALDGQLRIRALGTGHAAAGLSAPSASASSSPSSAVDGVGPQAPPSAEAPFSGVESASAIPHPPLPTIPQSAADAAVDPAADADADADAAVTTATAAVAAGLSFVDDEAVAPLATADLASSEVAAVTAEADAPVSVEGSPEGCIAPLASESDSTILPPPAEDAPAGGDDSLVGPPPPAPADPSSSSSDAAAELDSVDFLPPPSHAYDGDESGPPTASPSARTSIAASATVGVASSIGGGAAAGVAPPSAAWDGRPTTYTIFLYTPTGVAHPLGAIDLETDPGQTLLPAVRQQITEELLEEEEAGGAPVEWVFLSAATQVPVSKKQEAKRLIGAVTVTIAAAAAAADDVSGPKIFLRPATKLATLAAPISVAAPAPAAVVVPMAPEAPPLIFAAPPPPPPMLDMAAYASKKSGGFLAGIKSPSTAGATAASASPKADSGASNTNALLDAIRAGPKLRKVDPHAPRDPSSSPSAASSPGGLTSPGSSKAGGPVDMMAQLSQALAGRRNNMNSSGVVGGGGGGIGGALAGAGGTLKKFNLPKAAAPAVAATPAEEPAEVVWD